MGLSDTPDIAGIGMKVVNHDGKDASLSELDNIDDIKQCEPKNFGNN